MVDLLALANGWEDDERWVLSELLDIAFGNHNHILGESDPT